MYIIQENKLLEKIKKSGFDYGDGVILDSNMIKKAGEDKVVFAKVGEGFLNEERMSAIRELTKAMPLVKDLVKLNQPDFSKMITNKSSSIIINMPITGINHKSIVSNINNAKDNLARDLTNILRQK